MSAGSSPGRASVHERRARLYTGPDGPNDPPPYAHNTGRRVVYQRRGDKGLQGAQGWRRKKPRRRGTVRKAVWPQTHSCKILWWNARGLADDIDDLLDVMEREQVTVAVICETKSYGDELSRRGFTFLRGPETLPKPGMAVPRKGIGMLVSDKEHPHASVEETGTHSMWIKLPGQKTDMYVCGV